MDDSPAIPEVIPLFPLPDTALFPGAILPLHVFEPRYRTMVAQALEADKFIAIAMLRDGFEPLYYTRHAPIHRVVGVGRIAAVEELADGRYYILLHGVTRGEVLRELHDQPFRKALIRPLISFCTTCREETLDVRFRLRRLIRRCRIGDLDTRRAWLKLIDDEVDMDQLSDAIAAGIEMPGQLRQALLEELDAAGRVSAVLEQLRTTARINAVSRRQHRRHSEQDWNLN